MENEGQGETHFLCIRLLCARMRSHDSTAGVYDRGSMLCIMRCFSRGKFVTTMRISIKLYSGYIDKAAMTDK